MSRTYKWIGLGLGLGLGLGWDLCAGLFYEHRFAMLISEMSIFWCISMTNNVKSYKKFNGRVQAFRFIVFHSRLPF